MNSIEDRARRTLQRAIREGRIERQPCETCGNPKTDAHHDDYSNPLAVRWLCRQHHHDVHRGSGSRRGRRLIDDPALAGKLASMSIELRQRHDELRKLEQARNTAVQAAIDAGWTHAQVAQATGLTRARVGQIALQPRSEPEGERDQQHEQHEQQQRRVQERPAAERDHENQQDDQDEQDGRHG